MSGSPHIPESNLKLLTMTNDLGEPVTMTHTTPTSNRDGQHVDDIDASTAIPDELTDYTLAAGVFWHKAPGTGPRKNARDGTRYVRGDTIQLTPKEARRLLKCEAVVPVGTVLPPVPATVAYGEPVGMQWDALSRQSIERDIERGVLRPATGPQLFVR